MFLSWIFLFFNRLSHTPTPTLYNNQNPLVTKKFFGNAPLAMAMKFQLFVKNILYDYICALRARQGWMKIKFKAGTDIVTTEESFFLIITLIHFFFKVGEINVDYLP